MAKILIVDDYEVVRMLFADMLRIAGHDPVIASDGETALDILRTQSIDLIITDINMPRMNGPELLAALPPVAQQIPVILISGTVGATTDLSSKFFCQILIKPVHREQLMLAVDQALGSMVDP